MILVISDLVPSWKEGDVLFMSMEVLAIARRRRGLC
jgi:hypothetical protein